VDVHESALVRVRDGEQTVGRDGWVFGLGGRRGGSASGRVGEGGVRAVVTDGGHCE